MNPPLKRGLLAFAAAAACQGLLAQSTNPPSGAAADTSDDETIVLSPFEVSSSRDTGYQASQTLAGTRIRTDLRDVGAAVSVITKDFMNDIGATDTSTLLQYTTNAEVAGTRGTYAGLGNGANVDESTSLRTPNTGQRVRGLAPADQTRDFFVSDIPWDSFNVDRIDIQRGPNSILFGLGSPAGIVNATTRNAEFRNLGSVDVRFGSYGTSRASVDVNQELLPDVLAIRVDGLWNNEKYRQDYAFQNDRRMYGTVRLDPQLFNRRDLRTSIKAKFEHGEIEANRPRIVPPNDSITPWFKPMAPDQNSWTLDNGMGKTPVNNGYDANRQDLANLTPGSGRGLQTRNTSNPNYQPWLNAPVNQQQPFWLLDGTSGQTYRVVGGYINPGARRPDGSTLGATAGLIGKRYADQFFALQNLPTYATNANIPMSRSGQYRTASLTDPSIFDFYNKLIDGPNKKEWEEWDAYNFDFSQTALGDRIGVQLTYDRQKYESGGESALGTSSANNAPTITIDILKNFADFYTITQNNAPATGEGTTNPNFGRPYVISSAGGNGTSHESDRKYLRGSLFGEIRTEDFAKNEFLVKLLGKHRFNAVYSRERFTSEDRGWNRLATSRDWDAYWNGNDGGTSSFQDRPPMGFIYLGSSLANRDSATGSNIPGLTNEIRMNDGNVYVFDSTWQNYAVNFNDVWTPPAHLAKIYPPDQPPNVNNVAQPNWWQASNPANYVGWSYRPLTLLRYNDGQDDSLLTRAQKSYRQTGSYAVSWQGFLWNNAIIPTLGWRYDEVKTKDKTASSISTNRSMLDLRPESYRLPDEFPANQVFKDHSMSGGVVVHLNRLLARDPLPLDVSVSYNESNNFQVTSVRRDVYGNPLTNPTGNTKDYGVTISTKDGKYTFRAVKFETEIKNASSNLSNSVGLGTLIQQGLRFRNVFLYDLSSYDWPSRETPQQRNTWGGTANAADTTITAEEGRRREDAAIRTWNEIQAFLTPKGFFQAWGMNPVSLDKLTDRSTYEAALVGTNPPAQYQPDTAQLYAYQATPPQGFTVTADTKSEGYEFELTANPLPNWRVSINASQTEATRSNVGGPALQELVNFLDSKLFNEDGSDSYAGLMPQFGNAGLSINANNYNPWRSNYLLMVLQEGAAAPEIRKWRYNVVTNYDFRHGLLKGVGVGASYRWQDKVVIGYPVVQNGYRFTFDLEKPFYGPSEDAIDLWLSYTRKITSKIDWKIQLNIRNAFADDELIPISVQPDGKTWASVRVAPVQEWVVSNTFSF